MNGGPERSGVLILRCTIEDVAPETLRVHISGLTDLNSGEPRLATFATVEDASEAVHHFLERFARGGPTPGTAPASG